MKWDDALLHRQDGQMLAWVRGFLARFCRRFGGGPAGERDSEAIELRGTLDGLDNLGVDTDLG